MNPALAWPRHASARLGPAGLLALGLVLLASCADLPDVQIGECGNGVVEPPEDCDGFAPTAGSSCRAKGTAGQCRLDCRRRGDGTRPPCPRDWGCDLEGICRAATGAFEAPVPYKVGGAVSLVVGDLDGDGRNDVLSRGPIDAVGRAKARFHHFDERGALVDTRLYPKTVATPVITDISGDGRDDMLFTDPLVGLVLGRADRALIPETFAAYRFPATTLRLLTILDEDVERRVTPIVAFGSLNPGTQGAYVIDGSNGQLRLQASVPVSLDMLVGNPVSGDIIAHPGLSPCREVVFAIRGAHSFNVLDGCARGPVGQIVLRGTADAYTVALDPPAPIDVAPLMVDLNADGHLDVLVGAGRVYAAYGDGRGLAPAVPYHLSSAIPDALTQAAELRMPLAAGDFSGDGAVDFVFSDHLLISTPTPGNPLPTYTLNHTNYAATWTQAVIADLNGNRKLDVIAASSGRLDVDFFNGTDSPVLTPFTIPTGGEVQHLAIDDFDGDQIKDLALVEAAASVQERDALTVAFGTPAGPPLPPVPVGRVSHAAQLSVYRDAGLGNLMVASTEAAASGGAADSLLTMIRGSGDRLPHAPAALTSFDSNGSLQDWAAAGVSAGAFTAPGARDVVALVTNDFRQRWQFWQLRGLNTSRVVTMALGGDIDRRLRPSIGSSDLDLHINVVATSADVDGDGRADSIWAMPADPAGSCGLVTVGALASGVETLGQKGLVILEHPCAGSQLLPIDADGDGHVDLVLLTGTVPNVGPGPSAGAATERKLLVLWNDGKGQFAAAQSTTISAPGESPQAVAALPGVIGVRPFEFVYVNHAAVISVRASATPRQFAPASTLAPLPLGTGIATADVDGDGILDLVLAAAGNLNVMKAQLRP